MKRTKLYSKTLGIACDEALLRELQKAADSHGVPMSLYARNILREALTGSVAVPVPEDERD